MPTPFKTKEARTRAIRGLGRMCGRYVRADTFEETFKRQCELPIYAGLKLTEADYDDWFIGANQILVLRAEVQLAVAEGHLALFTELRECGYDAGVK